MKLSLQQSDFFNTFGFLVLPGVLADDIDWIAAEFAAVFRDLGIVHDGTRRSVVVPFIDQRERLCALFDDPRIEGILGSLLGEEFAYLGSDGNYFSGATLWHSDGEHPVGKYAKIAIYLDTVGADNGALRVIPGSHRLNSLQQSSFRAARQCHEAWGLAPCDVPALVLESKPGDVVAFDHNIMHASFGGDSSRRMFTINCCSAPSDPAELSEMQEYVRADSAQWGKIYGDIMLETASEGRLRHLRQVLSMQQQMRQAQV
jgi:hypothetical protein